MRVLQPTLTAVLFTSLAFTFAIGKEGIDEIMDISKVKEFDDAYRSVKPKSLNKEERVFVRRTDLNFGTECYYTAGDKDVSVGGYAYLVGVDNATFQAITDEYEVYVQQKLGEMFTVVPFEQVLAAKDFSKSKLKNPPIEYGVDQSTGLKSMSLKYRPFSAGNRPATEAWDKGLMGIMSELKSGSSNWMANVEFAFIAKKSGVTHYHNSKTASLVIEPVLWLSNAGNNITSQKYAFGGYANTKILGLVGDASWVKETRKPKDDTWEIVADPVLYKAAVLKLLKANADIIINEMKAVKAD